MLQNEHGLIIPQEGQRVGCRPGPLFVVYRNIYTMQILTEPWIWICEVGGVVSKLKWCVKPLFYHFSWYSALKIAYPLRKKLQVIKLQQKQLSHNKSGDFRDWGFNPALPFCKFPEFSWFFRLLVLSEQQLGGWLVRTSKLWACITCFPVLLSCIGQLLTEDFRLRKTSCSPVGLFVFRHFFISIFAVS